jgi:hypothetical protein
VRRPATDRHSRERTNLRTPPWWIAVDAFAAIVETMSVIGLPLRSRSFAKRPGPSNRMMPFDSLMTLSGIACITIS